MSEQSSWPQGWQEHKDDQNRWIRENSTADERIAWLFRMRELFAEQILAAREREDRELIARWNSHR